MFLVSVSQSSWDPINQLGQIKIVSCTRLQTLWTSKLFAVGWLVVVGFLLLLFCLLGCFLSFVFK